MAKVVQLLFAGALSAPIGQAIRTGELSCRRLEDLHAEERLPVRAVIVVVPKARFQKELTRSLRASGAEVMLDPNVAKLNQVRKFNGSATGTLWAVGDAKQPLELVGSEREADTDLFSRITRPLAEDGVASVATLPHLLRPSPPLLKTRQGPHSTYAWE